MNDYKEIIVKEYRDDKGLLTRREVGEELVRCKDCKWWDSEEHKCDIRDSYGWDYKQTDYCSYGGRENNE